MSFSEGSQILATVYLREHDDSSCRPKPGPHVEGNKDPDRLLLASIDRLDLIGLKFREDELSHFSIVEPAKPSGGSFQPAM